MALVKLRARLRTGGSRQISDSDRRSNEQAIAVARGEATLPSFIVRGAERWRKIRTAYSRAAAALDATGQSDDRELASDVRAFLDKHQDMNATPEVFALHHAQIIAAAKSKAELPALDRTPKDYGRGH